MNTRHHNIRTQSPLSGQKCFGGTGARVFTFHVLEPYMYISSDISHVSTTAHFRYLDHVSDIQLLQPFVKSLALPHSEINKIVIRKMTFGPKVT